MTRTLIRNDIVTRAAVAQGYVRTGCDQNPSSSKGSGDGDFQMHIQVSGVRDLHVLACYTPCQKGPYTDACSFQRCLHVPHFWGRAELTPKTPRPSAAQPRAQNPHHPPPQKVLFSPISEKARLRTFQRLFLLFRILTLLCSVAASIRQVDLRISLVQGLKLLELKPQCRISTKG